MYFRQRNCKEDNTYSKLEGSESLQANPITKLEQIYNPMRKLTIV